MKNKTIIMGRSGSGKSFKAINMAIQNKGTTIITNGCCDMERYTEVFPLLKTKFSAMEGDRAFAAEHNRNYFIEHNTLDNDSAGFVNALIFGCGFGSYGKDKHAMAIFDDGAWYAQKNKLLVLWQFSHEKCQIVITVDSWEDLLDMSENEITDEMKNDILKYWNVVHCEKATGKAVTK